MNVENVIVTVGIVNDFRSQLFSPFPGSLLSTGTKFLVVRHIPAYFHHCSLYIIHIYMYIYVCVYIYIYIYTLYERKHHDKMATGPLPVVAEHSLMVAL